MALVDVPLVVGPFQTEGRSPPVVVWRGDVFYWSEQLGGYRQWKLVRDLEQIDDASVVEIFNRPSG